MNYSQLENKIRTWAENEPLVQSLVVIGSHARAEHTADRWSDLDLILFLSDPQTLAQDSAWLNQFGEIWLSHLQVAGSGIPEWFVIYDGGLKADFLLVEANKALSEALYSSPFAVVARRGVRVLVNKGEPGPVQPVDDKASTPLPEAGEFENTVKSFWLLAFRAVSLLRRGDLWRARQIIDVTLRQQIVEMMAWHARAMNGQDFDTWHEGRYMKEWADMRALKQLPALFAPFEITASARALSEMLALYSWMAEETAVRLQYPPAAYSQARVRDWIESELRKMV